MKIKSMMPVWLVISGFLFWISGPLHAQKESTRLDSAFESVTGEDFEDRSENRLKNSSFVTDNGEKVQRFEIRLDAPLDEVWKVFITEQGLKSWQVPVVELDFRIGGTQKSHYDKSAQIGDEGTITNNIVNYLPMELITYKVNLTSAFPEKCRNEDDHLQYMFQFREMENTKTKIIFSMFGWGRGKEWEEVYRKFEKGNRWTFQQLIKRFTSGPVEW